MIKSRKTRLTPLERKCLMKFYLHELKLFRENSNEYVKSLGIEGGYETIELLVEEEPEFMKVSVKDVNNFVVLLDENCQGDYTPLFVMRDGVEQEFDSGEEC